MGILGGLVEGFGNGQNWRKNYYENSKLAKEDAHLAEKLAMEQKMREYETGIAGTKNQYLPEQMRLANQQSALVNQFYAPNIQSEIENRKANTESTKTNTKYKPLDELIKAQASSNSSKRFGASFQLRQALASYNPADRALWISQHQDEYSDMLTNLANGQHEPTGISPEVMAKFFPEMGISTPKSGIPQPSPAVANAMPVLPGGLQQDRPMPPMNGMQTPSMYPAPQDGIGAHPMMQQGQTPQAPPMMQQQPPQGGIGAPIAQPPYQQQPFSYSTPEQNQALKRTGEMAANKYLTTAATLKQMEAAIQIESFVNDPETQEQVKLASQYAGAAGKGKLAIAALSQTNPEAYEAYKSLKNITMPLLLNRIKSVDQMGGTDKQREELLGFFDKGMDSYTSNPKEFIKQYNAILRGLEAIAKGVQKSASPVANVNRLSGSHKIPEKGGKDSEKVRVYNLEKGKFE